MSATYLREAVASAAILPFVYCYPPRTAYVEDEAPTDLKALWALDAETSTDLNIYIHIPFCRYRCTFCALYTVTTHGDEAALHRAYIDSVIEDLRSLAPVLAGRRVRTVFIGGGTPLAVGAALLVELLTALGEVFPDILQTAEEITVEASPDSVEAVWRDLPLLVAAGVNRMSMGVQSLDREELKRAGRGGTGHDMILKSLGRLRAAGIANVGADLIVGLQEQTDTSMARTLDSLLDFRPETVSVYMINPRVGTALGRQMALGPELNRSLYKRMEAVSARLRASGYERETSVQFKIPGKGGLLHKRLYFDGVPVLGLGTGARSYTGEVDYLTGGGGQRTRSEINAYLAETGPRRSARKGVRLTADDLERRAIILSLQDLRIADVPRDGNGSFREPYASVLAASIDLGLMREDAGRLKLTEKGFLHRDAICWSLFSSAVMQRHTELGVDFASSERQAMALRA